MNKDLQRIAYVIGAVVVGLAVLMLVFKSFFFLFRLAVVVAIVGAIFLVLRAVQNAWHKSRCDKCGTILTPTEYTLAMPLERLRPLIAAGNLQLVKAMLQPRQGTARGELVARLRECGKCGATTWFSVVGPNGEVLIEEQKWGGGADGER